jgi:hypothetical protein
MQKEIRKRLTVIIIAFLVPVLLVIVLFKLSIRPNLIPNGFRRQFNSHPLTNPLYFKKLFSSNFYIAGKTNHHLYLTDYFKPSILLIYDLHLNFTGQIRTPVSDNEFKSTQIEIDSPFAYLYNGSEKIIAIYRIESDSIFLLRNLYTDKTPFNRACFLSASSFFLRTASNEKSTLSKFTVGYPLRTVSALQKQVDGFFCTDGLMNVDHISSHLFYIYYYRNQFICMDSSLHVLYQASTIDTNRFAKLSITQTGKKLFTSMSSLTMTINNQICITSRYFLVNSALLADNENRTLFFKSSVIDAYDLTTGVYRFSFYLTRFNNVTLKNFVSLGDDKLAAIEGNYLLVYPLGINL